MFSQPKHLLRNSLRRAGIEEQVDAVRVFAAFRRAAQEVLGTGAAARLQPRALQKGALVVRVSSSVAATELNLRREQLLRRVNEAVGGSRVHSLRFVTRDDD